MDDAAWIVATACENCPAPGEVDQLTKENAKLREVLEELLHDGIGEYMNSTQGRGDIDNVAIFKRAKQLLEVKDE